MRSQDRRLTSLYEDLPVQERSMLALRAISEDNETTLAELCRSAPRATYNCTDVGLSDTLNAAAAVSVAFDRGFYKTQFELHRWLAARLVVEKELLGAPGDDGEVLLANIDLATSQADACIDETYAFVLGAEDFAHRKGLALWDLLALSMVAGADRELLQPYLDAPEDVGERLREDIDAVSGVMECIWLQRKSAMGSFNN